ncbi:bleomycin resistance protein [Pantoea sp. SGAir0215]
MVPELTVTNFARSFAFYVDELGFTVRIRRIHPDFAYLCYGEAQLMIEQQHDAGWHTAEMQYPLGRGINFQIEVSSIQQLHTRLVKTGTPLFRPLSENAYYTGEKYERQQALLVQDPDGYLLRFCQVLD